MICPKCRTATLCSITPYSAEPPCRCSSCGGYWVKLEAAGQLAETVLSPDIIRPDIEKNSDADIKAGLCPDGHGLLARTGVELDRRFHLDRCMTCGGVWFDQGEWEQLASAHLLDNLGELWTRAWQQRQRRSQQEKTALLLAEEKFGPELLQRLKGLADQLRGSSLRSEALAFLQEFSQKKPCPPAGSSDLLPAGLSGEGPQGSCDNPSEFQPSPVFSYLVIQFTPLGERCAHAHPFQGRMNPSLGLDCRHPGDRHPSKGAHEHIFGRRRAK